MTFLKILCPQSGPTAPKHPFPRTPDYSLNILGLCMSERAGAAPHFSSTTSTRKVCKHALCGRKCKEYLHFSVRRRAPYNVHMHTQ